MYRVTRKQLIRQKAESWEGECNCSAAQTSVIEFEDSRVVATRQHAVTLEYSLRNDELALGGQPYGPDKVIFESPTFYRSVTVTIEEIS